MPKNSLTESLPIDPDNQTGHPAPSPACKVISNVTDLAAERKKRARKKKVPREKVRITKDNWATLQPEIPGKKDIIQCSHKHGFALVINPGGERSFAMLYNCEDIAPRVRVLGKCKITPISAAHAKMDRIIKQAVITGGDISRRAQKKAERGALRLRAAHAEYVKVFGNPESEDPLSEGSIRRYGFATQTLMEALGGDVVFFDITRKDCLNAHDHLSDPDKKARVASPDAPLLTRADCLEYLKTGQPPVRQKKPRSRKGTLSAANYALHYLDILWTFHAKQFEQALICPVVAVEDRMIKTKSHDGQILPEDLAAFWHAVEAIKLERGLEPTIPVWVLYFLMLLLTGRRRTELLMLKWDSVDLKRGTYTVIRGMAKNRKQVFFPVGRWLLAQLKKHRATQADSTEWVWAYPEDTRLSGQRLQRSNTPIDWIRKTPKFAKFRMHDARRTFATIAITPAVETPLLTHHKLLNHHINDQTGEYAKISPDMMRPYVQRVENVMLALTKATSKDDALDIITTKMGDK